MRFNFGIIVVALLGLTVAAPIATSNELLHHTIEIIQRDPKEAATNAYPTNQNKRDPKEAATNAHYTNQNKRNPKEAATNAYPTVEEKRAPHEAKIESYKLKRNPNNDSIVPTKCQPYKRDGAATNACPVGE
jgi:hypothetical protein